MNKKMNFSENGKKLLKELEGVSYVRYKDAAGYWTIGVGHKMNSYDLKTFVNKIDEETVDNLLRIDLAEHEEIVNSHVDVELTQYQFDALVIFSYNVGVNAFYFSTLRKKINKGDMNGAVEEFDKWVYVTKNGVKRKSIGLQNRRDEEQELFTDGDYEKQR